MQRGHSQQWQQWVRLARDDGSSRGEGDDDDGDGDVE
jgi:hypothetical protein